MVVLGERGKVIARLRFLVRCEQGGAAALSRIWNDTPIGYKVDSVIRPYGDGAADLWWIVASTTGRDISEHPLIGPYPNLWQANRAAHFMAAQAAARDTS